MAGPSFDASTALEMLGFLGPEGREGLQALQEKRPPKFPKGFTDLKSSASTANLPLFGKLALLDNGPLATPASQSAHHAGMSCDATLDTTLPFSR